MADRDELTPELHEVAADCGNFKLRKAARVVTRVYERFTREAGLKPSQFSLLVALGLHGPVEMTRLAETMGMERTSLTRNLRPLEKDGLVSVVPGRDRRTRAVDLTRHGRECLAQALPAWRQAQAYMAEQLGEQGWDELRRSLAGAASVEVPE